MLRSRLVRKRPQPYKEACAQPAIKCKNRYARSQEIKVYIIKRNNAINNTRNNTKDIIKRNNKRNTAEPKGAMRDKRWRKRGGTVSSEREDRNKYRENIGEHLLT